MGKGTLNIQGFWCLQGSPWNHSCVDTMRDGFSPSEFTMPRSRKTMKLKDISEKKDGIMERDMETMLF